VNQKIDPSVDFLKLLLCFLVRISFSAGIAELFEVNLALNRLTIFGRVIVDIFALRAAKFYEVIL